MTSSCLEYAFQMPWYSKDKTLKVGSNKDMQDASYRLEVTPRLSWPMPCIQNTSIKK